MAARENQGLHIALILLSILSIGLMVGNYVFYASSADEAKRNQDLQTRNSELEQANQRLSLQTQRLKYFLSGGATTMQQLESELENIASASDPDMEAIEAAYNRDMQMFADNFDQKRNYQALPTYLIGVINAKNKDLSEANNRLRQNLAETAQYRTQQEQLTATYKDAQDKAEKERDAERQAIGQLRTATNQAKADLESKLTSVENERNQVMQDKQEIETRLTSEKDQLEKVNLALKNRLSEREDESFERPDAEVVSVNQRSGELYINVGVLDGLRTKQTFSVYDKTTSGVMADESSRKGRIEVVEILGDHAARCRIVEDDVRNIMVPGDVVHTPAWVPGQRLKFAVAGFVDITDNGQSDMELLKSILSDNGGEIVDEVNAETRFLIEGERKSSKPNEVAMSPAEEAEFSKKITVATQLGVKRMSLDAFLAYMGWRSDVRIVKPGEEKDAAYIRDTARTQNSSGRTSGAFRKRTPGRGKNGAFD